MQALFDSVAGDSPLDLRNRALLEVLYGSGIRLSECSSLSVSDIDFDSEVMLIHGKGNKERYAPLGSFAQDALQEYFREGRQVLMTKYHEEHDIVFVNHHGKPITPTGIEYVLNQMIKKSSLDSDIHPHMLRHTFATHLLNNGIFADSPRIARTCQFIDYPDLCPCNKRKFTKKLSFFPSKSVKIRKRTNLGGNKHGRITISFNHYLCRRKRREICYGWRWPSNNG